MENRVGSTARVAVLGSCVSRDVFNRLILGEDYKTKVEVVGTVYQTALPSLERTCSVEAALPVGVKTNHQHYLQAEWSGRSLQSLVDARPDIVIADFFADVHFGTVEYQGSTITRNTMAFESHQRANDFFDGATENRKELTTNNWEYEQLAISSVKKLISLFHKEGNMPTIVVNSARYALKYDAGEERRESFKRNIEALIQKNDNWNTLDQTISQSFDLPRIQYPQELFVGNPNHKWGLHPVHYTEPYYKYLWKAVQALISQEKR